jgi:TolA-binding protein
MQLPTDTTSPTWLPTALIPLATFLVGGGAYKLFTVWLNRNKPAAETTEITVRTTATASDSIMRMMDRLQGAQEDIDRLRSERNEWQERAEKGEIETRLQNYQIERQQALLKLHGIDYSEFDRH